MWVQLCHKLQVDELLELNANRVVTYKRKSNFFPMLILFKFVISNAEVKFGAHVKISQTYHSNNEWFKNLQVFALACHYPTCQSYTNHDLIDSQGRLPVSHSMIDRYPQFLFRLLIDSSQFHLIDRHCCHLIDSRVNPMTSDD